MAPNKSKALADEIADILQDTPIDVDPEHGEAHDMDAGFRSDADDEAARSHYVSVGKSRLRHDQDFLVEDEKYVGKKTTRDLVFEDDFHQNKLGSDDDDVSDQDDVSNRQSETSEHDSNEEDNVSEEEDDEDNEDASSEQESDQESDPNNDSLQSLARQDTAYLKAISSDVSADIEKGKQIKNQIHFYDNLLDLRIRTQQCLNLANALPYFNIFPAFTSNNPEINVKKDDLIYAAKNLTNALIDARCEFAAKLPHEKASEVAESIGEKRKRSMDNDRHCGKALWQSISELDEQLLKPFRDETVSKWHNKVHVIGIGKQQLKALNQSPVQQIANMIATDMERLVKRTRVSRTDKEVIGKTILADQEKTEEIFDDSDFYAQLLRDLIDSKMANQNDPLVLSKQWVKIKELQRKNRKQKAGVDRKASKGRRLRFHVHEKIANFMAPQPRGTWHDEMTDELFRGLTLRQ